MELTISEQDSICAAGESACRSAIKDAWKLNPYKEGTNEHDIWLGGYERQAEVIGSQGKDW